MDDNTNPLCTNKSLSAQLRDAEIEVAGDTPPVDLSTVPREQWMDLVGEEIVPHPSIRAFLDGHHGPFAKEEVQNLEIAMEKGYGVEPPLCIVMSLGMSQSGRPWTHIETPNLTGFSLELDDE